MRYPKTWIYVGGVSGIIGMVCFLLRSTYNMSFRKLGRYCGVFVYLSGFIIMWCLVVGAKKIPVPKKFQSGVGAIIFVAICSISVVHDKYVTGISDAFTIISYGSFALMSVSMSKKLELGFETGFTNFFLQLFTAQLFKIKWFLLPIALVFCSLIIILRHYPEGSKEQGAGANTPDRGSHVGPPSAQPSDLAKGTHNTVIDVQSEDSLEMGEFSGQRQLSTNKKKNIQEESSKAESSYSWEQGHVSSANYQNGWMHSSPRPQLRRRRRNRRTPAIQNISSSLSVCLSYLAFRE